ncbi:MAG: alkaline phosphatase, partial [Bacteroidetes bacterium]
IKTYNGAIGVDPSKKAVPNIVEQVSAMGMETGLVVTSTITHATPAAFYAHQPRRDMYEAIAADLAASEIDFFVGGGTTDFVGRQDGRNLIDEMRNNGFFLTDSATVSFDKVQIPFDKKFGYFSSPNAPVKASEGRDYLPLATQKAIQYLKRNGGKKGFFLMVEGSQIDWGGHANDSDYIVSEMLDFDKAVGAALDFAEEDGNTLVIITADHETGGYSILPGSEMNKIRPGFTTDSHTASLIPVFAFGPGQELFAAVYENTAIYHKMVRALSLSKKLQP